MAIAINKGKVPKDYTVCVLDINMDQSFDSSAGVINSNLTTLTNKNALSRFPPYYMIAEVIVERNSTVGDMSAGASGVNWKISIDTEIVNKYRFIRFILDPMITITNNGSYATGFLKFTLSLTVNGSTYTYSHVITENIKPGFSVSLHDMAFLFDTKTGLLTDGFNENGVSTAPWS